MTSSDAAESAQAEVVAFLSRPEAYAGNPTRVDVVRTHANLVFLANDEAFKIKRAVTLAYLDFSSPAMREAACRREIEINQPHAPEIYLGTVPITREADGHLAIDGRGTPVEWAVQMARFAEADVLARRAEQGPIAPGLAEALARMLADAHERAQIIPTADGHERMARTASGIAATLAEDARTTPQLEPGARQFADLTRRALERAGPILDRRAQAGLVRRCHGDLHLGNIVLWKGQPALFDAIEFDETLAQIDVLYDLAFLLMDLDRRGQHHAAQIVLDRYLSLTCRPLDLEGLAALPLFLGTRAAIRAMVAADRARGESGDTRATTIAHAAETLALAASYLSPPPPRLLAIGGFSGTGKTSLAARLAPRLLPAPGAIHLRSDVLRKQLAGVTPLTRLPPEAYTPEARRRIYSAMVEKSRAVLGAGHSVIVDAVFDRPDERAAFEALARETAARFDGFWLEAPSALLAQRVAARTGDASDATPDVVDAQLRAGAGPVSWLRLDTGGSRDAVAAKAAALLGLA